MKAALENEEAPFDADLEKVLPGVHERLNAHTSQLHAFGAKLDGTERRVGSLIEQGIQIMLEHQTQCLTEQSALVGASLVHVGQQMLSPRGDSVGDAASTGTNQSPPASPLAPKQAEKVTNSNSNQQLAKPTAVPPEAVYPIKPVHKNFKGLWEQWFGFGECRDEFGGVPGRNERFGSAWRKESGITPDFNSRMNRVIKAAVAESKDRRVQPVDVVDCWEEIFAAGNYRLSTLVANLMKLGKIKKKASRGKTKKETVAVVAAAPSQW